MCICNKNETSESVQLGVPCDESVLRRGNTLMSNEPSDSSGPGDPSKTSDPSETKVLKGALFDAGTLAENLLTVIEMVKLKD